MNPDVVFPHLGIEIEHLPRTILFGRIYIYGVIVVSGIMAGLAYGVHEAKRTKQNPDLYMNFLFYALIAAIIGARLYYVAFSWGQYKDNILSIFAIREGGLAIYGGVLASIVTAAVYVRFHDIDFWLFADTAAPGLVLGQAIGRWGNFFNREAFGGYTDSLFAMRYLQEQADYTRNFATPVMVNGAAYIQVHPTFLYESLWCLFLFIVLNLIKRHKKFDGQIFALYLAGYGMGRFIIEGMRTDQLLLWGTNIAVSQALSLFLAVIAIGFIVVQYRRTSNNY